MTPLEPRLLDTKIAVPVGLVIGGRKPARWLLNSQAPGTWD